ncbi:MAG TPA: twin-arginine translocation signal domain-containing protein, partial [Vicinamibacterales bacterium]|nr:twin-arginine translocation signal domain-containing protein [Vicinamibacterales bacterium]
MDWTRRQFLASAAAGAAGLSVGARLRAADQVQEQFGEFPLAGLVQQFRVDQARRGQFGAVGRGAPRDGYLSIAAGIVRFFAT